ncbi:MAG TPA: hypothetical protein VNM22_06760 [Candidatus Limnocylindrales bacterium]|nr:hypothetical protein [Candidatus Limnocylindrales bacterium]
MQKSQNPLADSLRILTVFGGLAGIYLLYNLFQLAGPLLTPQDVRFLLVISITTTVLALIILFSYLALFLLEWILQLIAQLRKLKSSNPSLLESERFRQLEFTMATAFERIESRLAFIEDKMGEEEVLPSRFVE